MQYHQKYVLSGFLAIVALLSAASFQAAWAQSAPSLGSASTFAVLSGAPGGGGKVTCTNSTITGNVGSSGPPASVVQVGCVITGAIIAPVSAQVLTDFNGAYDALALEQCTQILTGSLAGVTLPPGVYCFPAAATLTGQLTLDGQGDANAVWIFKIGSGFPPTGALTGTGFSVVMANGGQPCNVFWWVAEAATMTDSDVKGSILTGAAITITRGTFVGRALAKAGVTITGPTAFTNNCGTGDQGCQNQDREDDHQGDGKDCDHHNGDDGEKSH